MMKVLSFLLTIYPWLIMSAQNTFPSSGNVGIGTTSPSNLLYVYNSNVPANSIGGVSEVANFVGTIGNIMQMKFLYRRHTLNGDWNNVGSRLQAVTDISNQGYLEFNPQGDPWGIALGSGSSELIRIKQNGNIGIGTSNPLEKFQIGDRLTFQDGGWKGICYNMAWNNTLNANARIISSPAAGIFFTDQGNIVFQNAPNGSAGAALNDAIYTLIIHNSGQVGIGTNYSKTSFQDQTIKLFVEGGIRSRKVKVDQSTWSDYVFATDYKLLNLTEVEKYIKDHKHLPEIPTAKEVEEKGLDLGDNQAMLLKKIEELTLYIIELNKKIETLQKEKNTKNRSSKVNKHCSRVFMKNCSLK